MLSLPSDTFPISWCVWTLDLDDGVSFARLSDSNPSRTSANRHILTMPKLRKRWRPPLDVDGQIT